MTLGCIKMKNRSRPVRDVLTEKLALCSLGWVETVDAALVDGAPFQTALKATRLWLAGNYEHADRLLQQGEDVNYTIVTDVETLASVIPSLERAEVIAIDTETYAPEDVRFDFECAHDRFALLTLEFERAREFAKRANGEAEKRAARMVRDTIRDEWKAAKAKLKSTESTLKHAGLDPHQANVRLIQLAIENRPVVMVDLDVFDDMRDLEPLRRILMDDSIKVLHNANFDLQMLWSIGFEIGGNIFDTMIAARLINPKVSAALDNVVKQYFSAGSRRSLSKDEQLSDWSGDLTDSQWLYAARDVSALLPLRKRLKTELIRENLAQIAKIEFDCVRATAEMEYVGMKIDSTKADTYRRRVEAQMAKLRSALYAYLGEISLTSPKQLKTAFSRIGVGVDSTARRALWQLTGAHPSIPLLLAYKKLSTLISVCLEPLPRCVSTKTGRVHASYWQLGTATGRFSCSGPNFQQVPRNLDVRGCFVAEEDNKLVIADYSQIELRVAAEVSGDRKMTQAYQNGEDLHTLTASLVQKIPLEEVTPEQRQAAKAINFGLIFGMGAKGLRYSAKQNYGVEMTLREAETFRNRYFESYSGIRAWHRKSGWALRYTNEQRTLCGRRFVWDEAASFTIFINRQVQGTAADIIKIALSKLVFALKDTGAKIIAMIHDEIIIEVSEANTVEAARVLRETMEAAGREVLKRVPVVAETRIADSWAEKKK